VRVNGPSIGGNGAIGFVGKGFSGDDGLGGGGACFGGADCIVGAFDDPDAFALLGSSTGHREISSGNG
jgi:hypothetical protein